MKTREEIQKEQKGFIEFAKWFIHSRRMGLDKMEAKDFASALMSELCHIEPFQQTHYLMKEFEDQLGYDFKNGEFI